MLEQKQKISQQKGLIISFLELESFRACEQKKKKDTEKQSIGNFSAKIVLDKSRDIQGVKGESGKCLSSKFGCTIANDTSAKSP